jgi:hypothetical protein
MDEEIVGFELKAGAVLTEIRLTFFSHLFGEGDVLWLD